MLDVSICGTTSDEGIRLRSELLTHLINIPSVPNVKSVKSSCEEQVELV